MSEQLAELLRESAHGTIDDALRFIDWYEEFGQIVSNWDTTRYQQAIAIRELWREGET